MHQLSMVTRHRCGYGRLKQVSSFTFFHWEKSKKVISSGIVYTNMTSLTIIYKKLILLCVCFFNS